MRHNPDRKTGKSSARDRARMLRADTTPPERKLWSRLRAGRLGGLKFRRQHPIGPYTPDFYCAQADLAVELDGQTHDRTRDAGRDQFMRSLGLRVLRVSVSSFESDPDGTLAAILRKAHRLIAEAEKQEKNKEPLTRLRSSASTSPRRPGRGGTDA